MNLDTMKINIKAECNDVGILNDLIDSVKASKSSVEFLIERIEKQEKLIIKLVDNLTFSTNMVMENKE